MQYSTETTRKLADVYGVYRGIGGYDKNSHFYEDISFIEKRWNALTNYINDFEISLSKIENISDLIPELYKRKFNHDFKRKNLLNINLSLLTEKYPLIGREQDAKRLLMLEEMLYNGLSKFIKDKVDLLIRK